MIRCANAKGPHSDADHPDGGGTAGGGGAGRSSKSEARMQERARIVLLLAAEAMASRAVALKLGCMRGMVSKCWVRYSRDRRCGLSETGDRGAERKHGPDRDEGVLAKQDGPPGGGANWTAPLLARELGISTIIISGASTIIILLLRDSAPIRRRSEAQHQAQTFVASVPARPPRVDSSSCPSQR
jgi:hypothetical protein